ncbi:MAG TPA: hypothetical protein DCX77_12115 [Acidimicrobiaceae bacterium]|nr:hypothetical protein [Acidimicrobiaceae bacterium]
MPRLAERIEEWMTSPKCQLQQNRADYMEYLYRIHRRKHAVPGLVGTFTGLYEAHCMSIGKDTAEAQVARWHLEGAAIVADWFSGD